MAGCKGRVLCTRKAKSRLHLLEVVEIGIVSGTRGLKFDCERVLLVSYPTQPLLQLGRSLCRLTSLLPLIVQRACQCCLLFPCLVGAMSKQPSLSLLT